MTLISFESSGDWYHCKYLKWNGSRINSSTILEAIVLSGSLSNVVIWVLMKLIAS